MAIRFASDEQDQRAEDMAIRPVAPAEIDLLKPLWLALHDHHVQISPRAAGMAARSRQESWSRRRADYLSYLRAPETFVFVAETGDELVGYAFVTVTQGYAVWDSGERQAQLQTLSVAPSQRGRGVGARLLEAVRARLVTLGIETIALSAAYMNVRAHHFYERNGFQPTEIVFVAAGAEKR